MSITEGRKQAERPTPSSRQPRRDIPSSGRAPTRSAAPPPDCVDNSSKPLRGPSEAVSHERLVYAVCRATEPEAACLPGRETRDRRMDHRHVEEDVSDEMLLKNVADGDKAAMHIMFVRHREKVFQFIQRRVRNPSIVDDLVSQVFLDVWRSANKFESRARVCTWLLSIARFKAIGSLRERTHENIDQDELFGISDTGDTPDVALDRKETNGILRACIDKLSPADREIIDLVYYRGNSVAEASVIVGAPHATVRSRMFCARKQLARILVSAGFEAQRSEPTREKGEQHEPLADCI